MEVEYNGVLHQNAQRRRRRTATTTPPEPRREAGARARIAGVFKRLKGSFSNGCTMEIEPSRAERAGGRAETDALLARVKM